MRTLRMLGALALLSLSVTTRGGELAHEADLLAVRKMYAEGKLAHALRALDRVIAAYPNDPRLPPLRAQLAEAIARYLTPPASQDAAASSAARTKGPTPITRHVAEAGRDFVSGTAEIAMIWISPGTFFMSNPLGSDDDTSVTISRGFWLGQTEVTQEQWQTLMENDPFPSLFKGSDRPIEWVSWTSAMDFCRKLTDRERAANRLPPNHEYTLPTEAQWEYACRAGRTGNLTDNLDAVAWYEANSGRQTHPVAQKEPNAWGLYDMQGNVWEWCYDAYGGFPGGHVTDPRRDTAQDSGASHILRGGAWNNPLGECRVGSRPRQSLNYTGGAVGFRVALTVQRSGYNPTKSASAP